MNISITDNVIDSRDILELLQEVQDEIDELKEEAGDNAAADIEALKEEHKVWYDLETELEDESEWHDGLQLIADHYFTEYAQELAEEIGAIDRDLGWPGRHIDWEAAADELKYDHSAVDVVDNGRVYIFWFRSC